MLVIKVELWSHGFKEHAQTLARMDIINDGTGSNDIGNYVVQLWRKGSKSIDDGIIYSNEEDKRIVNRSTVKGHKRQTYGVWHLVMKALNKLYNKNVLEFLE